MSKRPSQILFSLIHALSKSEKRYFKLVSSLHSLGDGNQYIHVFDTIDKQSVYNEDALHKYAPKNQFHVTKIRLQENILKSLIMFHSSSSSEHRIKRKLIEARVLIDKGLFYEAELLLKKTKEQCYYYEYFILALECVRLEKEILTARLSIDDLPRAEILFTESKYLIKRIELFDEYHRLQIVVAIHIVQRGKSRTDEVRKNARILLDHPLIKQESRAEGYRARACLYNLMFLYYSHIEHKNEQAYRYAKKMIHLIFKYSHIPDENPVGKLNIYNHFIVSCSKIGKFDEARLYLNRLREMEVDFKLKPAAAAQIFVTGMALQLQICNSTGNFEEAINLKSKIETGLKKHNPIVRAASCNVLYYLFAYSFFGAGQYRHTLQWLNRLLSGNASEIRLDLLAYSKLLQLITYFEQGETDLFPYQIKSVYRLLLKRGMIFKAEKTLIDFFKTQRKPIENIKQQKQVFSELKFKLDPIFKNKSECAVLEYFDFQAWLESKISGEKFSKTVKRNSSNNMR